MPGAALTMFRAIKRFSATVRSLEANTTTTTTTGNPYVLAMFPYPSGALHMGHVRVYSISDALARFESLKHGSSQPILHPMGWDAFGLPAENAALLHGIQSSTWTTQNIEQMRSQLDSLNFRFSWDAELRTCDPSYYRWTQWLFGEMYRRGWAYRKEAPVSWDPVDKTVLAAEQVDSEGRSWRSGAFVEERMMPQWYLKISEFAEDLLKGLDHLEWPEPVKEMQRHWIGKQETFLIRFTDAEGVELEVSTKEVPNTLPMINGILLAKNHPMTGKLSHVINPVTGKQISVSTSDTDETQFILDSSVKSVWSPQETAPFIKKRVTFRMRDWLISRQRAWGTPIPIVYCARDGIVPVPSEHLPVLLPERITYGKSEQPGSPLVLDSAFMNCRCPKCGGPAQRESDTMDTFVDSSWYFLRYLDPRHSSAPFNFARLAQGKLVDWYVGGIEHAILHLLYARFITKIFGELAGHGRAIEPFRRLLTQGLVQGRTRKCSQSGRYLRPDEHVPNESVGWEKMSKSKFNGVEPGALVKKWGADCVRMGVLFKAPPQVPLEWEEKDLVGQERFLTRIERFYLKHCTGPIEETVNECSNQDLIVKATNDTVQLITEDMSQLSPSFNVHIASLMKLFNLLQESESKLPKAILIECMKKLALLLSVYAPVTGEKLKKLCGADDSLPLQLIPIQETTPVSLEGKVYFNGKELGSIKVVNPEEMEAEARRKYPQVASVKECISVKGKKLLVNFINK